MAYKNQPLGTRFHYNRMFNIEPIRLQMLQLIQIGEICIEPTFAGQAHDQFCHEVSFIISGQGVFEYNGERVPVSAGDIVITPGTGYHAVYASDQEAIFYAFAGFKFTGDHRFPEDVTRWFAGGAQYVGRDRGGFYNYFRKCIDEFYRGGEIDLLMVEACLTQIIIWATRAMSGRVQNSEWQPEQQTPGQLVYRILKHVEHHLLEPLTVAGVAAQLGYSATYISHVFKEKMGVTLQQYIADCKIDKAKELIAMRRFSMTEIAERLGYLNLQSFSRAFQKRTGLSPSEYKETL